MFLFLFLILDLYVLIPAIIAQVFNGTAELATPIETLNKEAKAEIETHPVVAEAEIK